MFAGALPADFPLLPEEKGEEFGLGVVNPTFEWPQNIHTPPAQFAKSYLTRPTLVNDRTTEINQDGVFYEIPLVPQENRKAKHLRFRSMGQRSMKALFKEWDTLRFINPACLVGWLNHAGLLLALCQEKGPEGFQLYQAIREAARNMQADGYFIRAYPTYRQLTCPER